MPIENQVRELDARLLLACVAAKRELTSVIGPKRKIESHIASFPRGIYLSKSLRIAQCNFFSITRRLGHEIVACERMVDVLEKFSKEISQTPGPGLWVWLGSWYKATLRRVRKGFRARQPGSLKSPKFERHRYPGITPRELSERIARFQQVLGDNTQLQLHQIYDKIFRISAC